MSTNERHTNRGAVDGSERVLTRVTGPGNRRVLEAWLTAHDRCTLVELTNVARDRPELIYGEGTPDLESVSLRRILSEELEERRETFSEAEIAMAEPPDRETRGLANELLSSVFRTLVTDDVRHKHTDHPTVRITVVENDESVRVRVADNGPGIPDAMKESLFQGAKNGLEGEGTGMGPFLVDGLVDSYGGDVRIEDGAETDPFGDPDETDHPRRTVVIVELRTAPDQHGIKGV